MMRQVQVAPCPFRKHVRRRSFSRRTNIFATAPGHAELFYPVPILDAAAPPPLRGSAAQDAAEAGRVPRHNWFRSLDLVERAAPRSRSDATGIGG
jgi:hypothetical protein